MPPRLQGLKNGLHINGMDLFYVSYILYFYGLSFFFACVRKCNFLQTIFVSTLNDYCSLLSDQFLVLINLNFVMHFLCTLIWNVQYVRIYEDCHIFGSRKETSHKDATGGGGLSIIFRGEDQICLPCACLKSRCFTFDCEI